MIVYQTRGVRTGGTVALNSLYETLRDLGYGAYYISSDAIVISIIHVNAFVLGCTDIM